MKLLSHSIYVPPEVLTVDKYFHSMFRMKIKDEYETEEQAYQYIVKFQKDHKEVSLTVNFVNDRNEHIRFVTSKKGVLRGRGAERSNKAS